PWALPDRPRRSRAASWPRRPPRRASSSPYSCCAATHRKMRSLDSCTARFRLFGGLRLVLVRGRASTRNGVVGARTQINIEVVDIAHHVHIGREGRHHLVIGGIDVLAAVGDDIDEVTVAQCL